MSRGVYHVMQLYLTVASFCQPVLHCLCYCQHQPRYLLKLLFHCCVLFVTSDVVACQLPLVVLPYMQSLCH